MGKGARQRELARARAIRQEQRQAELRQKRIRALLASTGVVVTLALVLGGLALAGTFSGSPKTAAAAKAAASAKPSASASPSVSPSASASPAFSYDAADAKATCDITADTTGSNPRKPGLPPQKPTHTSGTDTFTMTTNVGTIVFTGDAKKAPCTASAMAYLASKKYFDNTICHRLTTGATLKVLQCGDPTGTGSGGPGYTLPEENLTGATYTRGVVAMAKTSAPHSTGSQFFLVYGDSQLDPSYTVLGTITKGLDVLDTVAKAGSDNSNGTDDGKPKTAVTIKTLTASWKA